MNDHTDSRVSLIDVRKSALLRVLHPEFYDKIEVAAAEGFLATLQENRRIGYTRTIRHGEVVAS